MLTEMPFDYAAVRRLREKKGLKAVDAAKAAGMTRQRWNDIESGRVPDPQASTLESIAAGLHCSITDIMTKRK